MNMPNAHRPQPGLAEFPLPLQWLVQRPGKWIDPKQVQIGRKLAKQNAVADAAWESDGRLTGFVRDFGRAFLVDISADERNGSMRLSCGCRPRSRHCRHIAALVLGVASGWVTADGHPREEQQERLAAVGLSVGMTAQDLRRWAAERRMLGVLAARPDEVLEGAGLDAYGAVTLGTVEATLTAPMATSGRGNGVSLVPLHVRYALLEVLAATATHLREVAQEDARLAELPSPDSPGAIAAFERLDALRRRLMEETFPLPLDTREQCFVAPPEVETDPPALRFVLHRPTPCYGRGYYYARSTDVVVVLGDDQLEASVTCGCEREGPCPTAAAAVCLALEALALDTLPELEAVLGKPGWQRLVDALEAVAHAEPPPIEYRGGPAQLGWRLRDDRYEPLEPVTCRPNARGKSWMLRRTQRENVRELVRHSDLRTDQRVASILGLGGYSSHASDWIRGEALWELAGHPRVFPTPAAKAPVPVRRAPLELTVIPEQGGVRLGVTFGDVRFTPKEASEVLAACRFGDVVAWWDAANAKIRLARPTEDFWRLLDSLDGRAPAVPQEAVPALVARLPALSRRVPVRLEDNGDGAETDTRRLPADDRLLVRLDLDDAERMTLTLRVRPRADLQPLLPGDGPAQLFIENDGQVAVVVRDLDAERRRARELVGSLGLSDKDVHIGDIPLCWSVGELERALDLVATLQAMAADSSAAVLVQWAGAKRRVVSRKAGFDDLKLEPRKKRKWFALRGGLTVDGVTLPLSHLLEALRDRQRFVALGDGQWVALDAALRRELTPLAEVAQPGGKAGEDAEIAMFAAPLVDELREHGATISGPASWSELLKRVDSASQSEPEVPAGLNASLRPYQLEGFQWLARLTSWGSGAVLADDMGLGKTLQALALLLHRADEGPALVVAPTSLGFNWVREAERFAPALSMRSFKGKASLDVLDGLSTGDVVVTSYDLVARYHEQLGETALGTVILDEAQAIKNPSTKRAKAIFKLSAGVKVALTGTPVENRTTDLWSLFNAVAPGLLGGREAFHKRFAGPIERNGDADRRALLASIVRPFVLRRLKSEVAAELPPRTDITVEVSLSAAEQTRYQQVRAAAEAELVESSGDPSKKAIRLLTAMTRLRQLACHPRLVDPESRTGSSKLKVLRDLLVELRDSDHRALVFSQFTGLLALVRQMLDEEGLRYCYLDGSTRADARRDEVDRFQAGQADAFLLSLKAGGTGLNLTAADYVIHLDPWWNPAVEDQATDRAHRIGQERPVTVYRLVASGTIEEAILSMQDDKRELVGGLLAGTGTASGLSTEDLMRLLRASVGAA